MENKSGITSLVIDIEEEFRPFVTSAVARFRYLHPDLEVRLGDKVVMPNVACDVATSVSRDFRYALYREKIHAESADTRAALLGALLK